MKKIFVIITTILFSGMAFGQSLEKDNLIGIHVFSLDLDPDVTFNQYKNFFIQNYIPELNKNFPDVKHYFAMGNREENKNEIGLVVVFGSQEIKDKYYHADGSTTELMNTLQERIQPIRSELDSLGTVTAEYIEWVIQ
jgi:hypothetical protein